VPVTTTVVGTGDYNGARTIWTMNDNTITATTSFATPGLNGHLKIG
jgi:hypothetical protein